MLKITHRQLFKKGRLIADQKMSLIVKDHKAVARELARAQKRYKHRAGDYEIKFQVEKCSDETVKDLGVQLELF